MITRNLLDFPHDSSFFLFGPRQTGKTTAILNYIKDKPHWHANLLLSRVFNRYLNDPSLFRDDVLYQIKNNEIKIIFVDEIQKIPPLLDEIHQLIEETKVQFIMSGSSARKLKKGAANLLGGRAIVRYLFPLLSYEFFNSDQQYDLQKILQYGSLPGIFFNTPDLIIEKLQSYAEVYLKEEIQQEGLVRNLANFNRFLEVAAQHSSELVNYDNIGRESRVSAKTVKAYFEILSDTLIGHILPAWELSIRKQVALHPKFYFFDNGVNNCLTNSLEGSLHSELRGKLFEQWIINEVRANLKYRKLNLQLSFWRTKAGTEVDLIISKNSNPILAIEIKALKSIANPHLSGLLSFREEYPQAKSFLICEELYPRTYKDVEILPWKLFLEKRIFELL